ncbi:hypothetical protein D3C78_1106060 [compost metagenome]
MGDGVDVLVADDDLALLAHRFEVGQQEVREDAFRAAEVMVGRRPDRIDLVVDLLEHLVAVGVVDRLHVGGFLGGGTALHGVVEDQLIAVLRYGEWRGAPGIAGAIAVRGEFGVERVLLDGLLQLRVQAEVAVARVDRHLEGVRIAFEQGFLAVGQVLGVLVHVLRGDDEQRLLVGVRVRVGGTGTAEFHVRWDAAPFAAPGRNAAIGVAGLLGAHRRQVLVEACGLRFADLGLDGQAAAEQGDGKGRAEQGVGGLGHAALLHWGLRSGT